MHNNNNNKHSTPLPFYIRAFSVNKTNEEECLDQQSTDTEERKCSIRKPWDDRNSNDVKLISDISKSNFR
jgi:hypothetical protein